MNMIRLFAAVGMLAISSPAFADQVVTPPSFLNQPLNLGTGKLTTAGVNNWPVTLAAQDPPNWTTSIVAGGTGNAAGDVLTLNDGCATNATVTLVSVTSGAVTKYYISNRGSCLIAPGTPIAVLSTTGSGSGATFNIPYAPVSSYPNFGVNGATAPGTTGNLIMNGGASPPGLYGSEDVFIGGGAGGAFTGNSNFDTAIGLNACGVGGAAPSVGNSVTCTGDDSGRDLTGTSLTAIDLYGAGAAARLGSLGQSATGNQSYIDVYGAGAAANLTSANAPGRFSIFGAQNCPGTGNAFMTNVACFGSDEGGGITSVSNILLLGTHAGPSTLATSEGVILVASGDHTVDTPAGNTSNYISFEGVWTATGTGTPASSSSIFNGDFTAGGGGSALTTTATAGFTHPAFSNGMPTGTPSVATPACEWNQTSHSLDCHDTGGWYHVTFTSGAG